MNVTALEGRRCEPYGSGHVVHHIPANRSHGEPSRKGRLLDVIENVITVDYGDEIKTYRNHDPDRLVDIIGIGGSVYACELSRILRSAGSYCFSVSRADVPWIPCDFRPLRSTTPQALADRVITHGGFVVPRPALNGGAGVGA